MAIQLALSVMPGDGFRAASLPLFAAGVVDAVEWTYELGFGRGGIEPTLDALLGAYAQAGAFTLHGVSASPLGRRPDRFDATYEALRALSARHRPIHISEHFCFATGSTFRRVAPMPSPFTRSTAERARTRLAALADASGARVGIENLAFAFSRKDVDVEPEFLDAIVRPLGGFVVLDLHNLACRIRNFGLDPARLLDRYPADRVECLHVSGGSDSEVPAALGGGLVRRDTHDGPVPEDVHVLLRLALDRFPRVRQVVLERVPEALVSAEEQASFRAEFHRIRETLAAHRVRPEAAHTAGAPQAEATWVESEGDVDLDYQDAIVEALQQCAESADVVEFRRRLLDDPRSAPFRSDVDAMESRMIDVAIRLHRRWSA